MIIATQQQEFSWNSKYEMETPPCVYSAFAQKKFLSPFGQIKLFAPRDRHKGLNFSIFRNDVQMAAFTKNKIKPGAGDGCEIRRNDDANLIVVICMTLDVDFAEFNDDSASVTYDPGNTGPEERRFDAWEPS
jgi:hypothetical protein